MGKIFNDELRSRLRLLGNAKSSKKPRLDEIEKRMTGSEDDKRVFTKRFSQKRKNETKSNNC